MSFATGASWANLPLNRQVPLWPSGLRAVGDGFAGNPRPIAKTEAIRQSGEDGAAIPTLFTKIINREIPAEIVYEDEHCVAFNDINPQAPVHVLIVPRQEIAGLASIPADGDHRYLLNAAKAIAEQMNLAGGYRVVINEGLDAGQTVDHLHAHLLGGRKLGWPPG